jgi:hypothetical protein
MILHSFTVVLRSPRPPSVNALYSTGHGGARFLTAAGRAFKDALKDAVLRQTSLLPWSEAVDQVYVNKAQVELDVRLYLSAVYNKSWKPGGRTKPTEGAPNGNRQSPYKKVDAGSYDKVIQDAVALGTGIDDSAHMYYSVTKLEDREDPRIEVDYRVMNGD